MASRGVNTHSRRVSLRQDHALPALRDKPALHSAPATADPWGPAFDAESDLIYSRFVTFTKRLPRPVAKRGLDMRTYLGDSGELPRSGQIPECIRVITILPFVLYDAFPVRPDKLRTLAYALTVGGLYAMAEDKLIDSQTGPGLSHNLLVPSLYGEFIRALHQLFPANSDFWSYHDRFFREYQMAELTDDRRTGRSGRIPARSYYHVARNKSAPMKLALCGMAILSGRRNRIAKLFKSFDCWILGYQIFDDIVDWREDYLSRRQTLVGIRIRQLTKSAGAGAKQPRISDVAALIHSSGLVESMLDESGRWFSMAVKSVDGFQCENWIRFLRFFSRMTDGAIRDLVTMKVGILFNNS